MWINQRADRRRMRAQSFAKQNEIQDDESSDEEDEEENANRNSETKDEVESNAFPPAQSHPLGNSDGLSLSKSSSSDSSSFSDSILLSATSEVFPSALQSALLNLMQTTAVHSPIKPVPTISYLLQSLCNETVDLLGLKRQQVEMEGLRNKLAATEQRLNEKSREFTALHSTMMQETEKIRIEAMKENQRLRASYENEKKILGTSYHDGAVSSLEKSSLSTNGRPSISLEIDNLGGTDENDSILGPLLKLETDEEIFGIDEANARRFIKRIYERRQYVPSMRRQLCGALEELGSKLYASPAHFLHELLQNCDDNQYHPSMTPSLIIRIPSPSLHSSSTVDLLYILISNNERGFRPKDICSICSITESTKHAATHTGRKGLGFKAVFAASCFPIIISGPWSFGFRVPEYFLPENRGKAGMDEMNYIAPLWLDDQSNDGNALPPFLKNIRAQSRQHNNCTNNPSTSSPSSALPLSGTHFYLPLRPTLNRDFLEEVRVKIDPCVLLTTKKLQEFHCIDVDENHNDLSRIVLKVNPSSEPIPFLPSSTPSTESLVFLDHPFHRISAQRVTISRQSGFDVRTVGAFLVFHTEVDGPYFETLVSDDEWRNGRSKNYQRKFLLAYPDLRHPYWKDPSQSVRTNEGPLINESFFAYATLPIENSGLPFIVNADFDTTTSRDAVRDTPHNRALRSYIAVFYEYLILNVIELRERFLDFLPLSSLSSHAFSSSFFGILASQIEVRIGVRKHELVKAAGSKRLRLMDPRVIDLFPVDVIRDCCPSIHLYETASVAHFKRMQDLEVKAVSLIDIIDEMDDTHDANNRLNRYFDKQLPSWWEQFFTVFHETIQSIPRSELAPLWQMMRKKSLFRLRPYLSLSQSLALGTIPSASSTIPPITRTRQVIPPHSSHVLLVGPFDAIQSWRASICFIEADSDSERLFLAKFIDAHAIFSYTSSHILHLLIGFHLEAEFRAPFCSLSSSNTLYDLNLNVAWMDWQYFFTQSPAILSGACNDWLSINRKSHVPSSLTITQPQQLLRIPTVNGAIMTLSEATIPTICLIDISKPHQLLAPSSPFARSNESPFIKQDVWISPRYYSSVTSMANAPLEERMNLFYQALRFEEFLLQIGCQRPHLPNKEELESIQSILSSDRLLFPSEVLLSNECASLAKTLLDKFHDPSALSFLQRLPINIRDFDRAASAELIKETYRVPVAKYFVTSLFDPEACLNYLPLNSSPAILSLAAALGVATHRSIENAKLVLQRFSERGLRVVDKCTKWLVILDDEVRKRRECSAADESMISTLQDTPVYIPAMQKYLPLSRIIVPPSSDSSTNNIAVLRCLADQLQLHVVDASSDYFPLKSFLRQLGCKSSPSIAQCCAAIHRFNINPQHFIPSLHHYLKENARSELFSLYRLLEEQLWNSSHMAWLKDRKQKYYRENKTLHALDSDTISEAKARDWILSIPYQLNNPPLSIWSELIPSHSEVMRIVNDLPEKTESDDAHDHLPMTGMDGAFVHLPLITCDERLVYPTSPASSSSCHIYATIDIWTIQAIGNGWLNSRFSPLVYPDLFRQCPLLIALMSPTVVFLDFISLWSLSFAGNKAPRLLERISSQFNQAIRNTANKCGTQASWTPVQVLDCASIPCQLLINQSLIEKQAFSYHSDNHTGNSNSESKEETRESVNKIVSESLRQLVPDKEALMLSPSTLRMVASYPFLIGGPFVCLFIRYDDDKSRMNKAVAALSLYLSHHFGLPSQQANEEARGAMENINSTRSRVTFNPDSHLSRLNQFGEEYSDVKVVNSESSVLLLHISRLLFGLEAALESIVVQPKRKVNDAPSTLHSNEEKKRNEEDEELTDCECLNPRETRTLKLFDRAIDAMIHHDYEKKSEKAGTEGDHQSFLTSRFTINPSIRRLDRHSNFEGVYDDHQMKRCGENAEFFMYRYLDSLYNGAMRPSNWISSARRRFFPSGDSRVNDGAGYDFVVVDSQRRFETQLAQLNRSIDEMHSKKNHSPAQMTDPQIFIEVKGNSGRWNGELFISANELNACANKATTNHNIYIVAVIENVFSDSGPNVAALLPLSLMNNSIDSALRSNTLFSNADYQIVAAAKSFTLQMDYNKLSNVNDASSASAAAAAAPLSSTHTKATVSIHPGRNHRVNYQTNKKQPASAQHFHPSERPGRNGKDIFTTNGLLIEWRQSETSKEMCGTIEYFDKHKDCKDTVYTQSRYCCSDEGLSAGCRVLFTFHKDWPVNSKGYRTTAVDVRLEE